MEPTRPLDNAYEAGSLLANGGEHLAEEHWTVTACNSNQSLSFALIFCKKGKLFLKNAYFHFTQVQL